MLEPDRDPGGATRIVTLLRLGELKRAAPLPLRADR